MGLVLGGLWLVGCTFKGGPAVSQRSGEAEGYWQVRPVRMRVFPTTLLVQNAEGWHVEAAIEFLDETGDSVKAVGGLRFELWEGWGAAERREQRMLESWNYELLTRRQNQAHYDSLTRTYRFRLAGRQGLPGDRLLTLVVIFRAVEGERLETQAVLESGQAQEPTAR